MCHHLLLGRTGQVSRPGDFVVPYTAAALRNHNHAKCPRTLIHKFDCPPLHAGDLDIVDIFRKPSDVLAHVEDVLAKNPRAVWLQTGITCPAAEEAWARAGIKVVSDRCLMVEHRAAPRM